MVIKKNGGKNFGIVRHFLKHWLLMGFYYFCPMLHGIFKLTCIGDDIVSDSWRILSLTHLKILLQFIKYHHTLSSFES